MLIWDLVTDKSFCLCCIISWSLDSKLVVTASRDGRCSIWSVAQSKEDESDVSMALLDSFVPFDGVAVTAVAMTTYVGATTWLLAVGSEKGVITCFRISISISNESGLESSSEAVNVSFLLTLAQCYQHGKQIR